MRCAAIANFIVLLLSAAVSGIIVRTKNGRVRGVADTSFSGRPYHSFHAIPFAQPPLGDLRFTVSYSIIVL